MRRYLDPAGGRFEEMAAPWLHKQGPKQLPNGDFKPGERRRIILRSRPDAALSSISYPAPAKYTLVVIPEWKEPLPVIFGEFWLKR
jgi:hypothetical protein